MIIINRLLLILFFVLLTSAQLMQWYVTRQALNSQQPSPRSAPHFLAINNTHGILFAGFHEHISEVTGQNIFYNDVYVFDGRNPDLVNWTLIQPLPGSPVPGERAFPCGVWYKSEGALYIYGGLNYTTTFSQTTLYEDAWKFKLSTRTWTKLTDHAPPGRRASMTCDILQESGLVHLSYGVKDTIDGFQNDNWSWDLSTNTWTLLTTSTVKPIARALHTFARIPNTPNFLFLDGVAFPSNGSRRQGFEDIWTFNTQTHNWKQLNIYNAPDTRDAFIGVITSQKYFFMHSGHIFTNQTIAENCLPPLSPCNADATATDESYFLRLSGNNAIWGDELRLEHSTPPVRRSWAILLKPFVYLTGGMGWSGKNGVGELYNYYTYGIQLKENYFNDF